MEDNVNEVTQNVIGNITTDESDMINLRKEVIGRKQIELSLLQNECDGYFAYLRNKYKLENVKEFIIDKEGKIIEVLKKSEEE